jgi:DNA-binding HxlR family transcriptional regulator
MANQLRPEDLECPLSTALAYVGDWWTLLLLHDLFDGYSRFDQFQQNLGISSSILTMRLKTLQQNGIVERRRYQNNPPRYEYVLTELGISLRPVIVALAAWGNARRQPEQRSMILVDRATGEEVEPVLVDRKSGRPVVGDEFIFTAGPSAGEAMRRRYLRDSPTDRSTEN